MSASLNTNKISCLSIIATSFIISELFLASTFIAYTLLYPRLIKRSYTKSTSVLNLVSSLPTFTFYLKEINGIAIYFYSMPLPPASSKLIQLIVSITTTIWAELSCLSAITISTYHLLDFHVFLDGRKKIRPEGRTIIR